MDYYKHKELEFTVPETVNKLVSGSSPAAGAN